MITVIKNSTVQKLILVIMIVSHMHVSKLQSLVELV